MNMTRKLTSKLLTAIREQDVLAVLHFVGMMNKSNCLEEGLEATDASNGLPPLFTTIESPFFPLREIILSILLLKTGLSPNEELITYAKEKGVDGAVHFLTNWETVEKEDAEDAELLLTLPIPEAGEWIKQHLPPPPDSANLTGCDFSFSVPASLPSPAPSRRPSPSPSSPITTRSASPPPPESASLLNRIGPLELENRPSSSFFPSSQLIRSLTRNAIRTISLPPAPTILPLPALSPCKPQRQATSILKISRLPEFFNHNDLIETLESINIEIRVLSFSIADLERHAIISLPLESRESVVSFLSNRFIDGVPLLVQSIAPVSFHALPRKPQDIVSPVLENPCPEPPRSRSHSSSSRPQCPPSLLFTSDVNSVAQAPLSQRIGSVARPRSSPRKTSNGKSERPRNDPRRRSSSRR